MPKQCSKCGDDMKGFGTVCSKCRLGAELNTYKCESCGGCFNGTSNICDQCGKKAAQVGGKPGPEANAPPMPVDVGDQTECKKCGKPFGTFPNIIFEGNRYHAACFVCDRCSTSLQGGVHKKEDGTKLCSGCINPFNCDGCHKKLSGAITKVNGKQYHPDCFKCDVCGAKLVGGFARVGDKSLCKDCAKNSRSAGTCVKCEKPITSAYMTADKGDKFHTDCFRCFICEEPLKSYIRDEKRTHTYMKARYLCQTCSEKDVAEGEAATKPCKICGTLYPDGTYWCTKCQAPTSMEVDESKRKCVFCQLPVEANGYELSGKLFHIACFKCADCGAPAISEEEKEGGKATLINSKFQAAQQGKYKCNNCTAKDLA